MQTFFNDIKAETFQYYDALVAFVPKLLMALVIVVITWFLARLMRGMSDRGLKQQMEDPLLARFLANLIRTVVIIIGVTLALKTLGFGGITASILAGAGITAFIIGFALRDIGENFLAGIIMAFKRPFRVGDFIESGPIKGKVVALNIRETQVKTQDGKDVFIPNGNVIKTPLINYTVDGFLRYDLTVGLPEDADHKKVMQTIRDAVNQVDGVLKKRRRTTVDITGLGPGRLDVTVSFWIDNFGARARDEKIRSEVILQVRKAIDAGLQTE